jgi:hypothetical protein
MIIIKAITNTLTSIDENGNTVETIVVYPERQLTEQEASTITSNICDGINYTYYQGDEI